MQKNPQSSGGNFSEGYIVESTSGQRAYLKALDLSQALEPGIPDPIGMINVLTEAFLFERNLLERCRSTRLDRVVTAIDSGTIGASPNDLVFYLVFELADGDVREQMEVARRIDVAWSLRTLHQIAVALKQLHSQHIAHQDVKPSNVLLFGQRGCKVADLGRAVQRGSIPPHENYKVAGDKSYAPPELLFGHLLPDWTERRIGCDIYLLGSMVVSLFTGIGMSHLLIAHLQEEHKPTRWQGTYEEVLPFVVEAFGRAIEMVAAHVDPRVSSQVCRIVRELCDPDPARRGHPVEYARRGNQYSLERYITNFDLLARRAELEAF